LIDVLHPHSPSRFFYRCSKWSLFLSHIRGNDAKYYFCLNNGLSYAEALDIQTHVPLTGESRKSGDVVYTGSIIAELNDLETKEELIAYLIENISGSTFTVNQDAPSDLSR
jgi:hypothetical protein